MLIPDLKVYEIVKLFLKLVKDDYDLAPVDDKSRAIISELFTTDDNNNVMKLEKLKFYNEAFELFARYTADDNPNAVGVSIGYNLERANLPHVHIMLANKSKGRMDAIGLSEAENLDEVDYANSKVTLTKQRTFQANLVLLFTGKTVAQVLCLQYFFEAMLDIFSEHIGLTGLLNLRFSAQDVRLMSDLAPQEIFSRNIVLEFDYENNVKLHRFQEMARIFSLTMCGNIGTDYDSYIKE